MLALTRRGSAGLFNQSKSLWRKPAAQVLFSKALLLGDLRGVVRIVLAEMQFLVGVTGERLDRSKHVNIAPARLDIEFAELACGHERAAFKARDEAVVIVDGGREPASDAAEIVRGLGEAVVELLAELTDLTRFLGEPLLPPHGGNGARDRDEVGRRREQHLLVERIVPERRVLFQSRGEE